MPFDQSNSKVNNYMYTYKAHTHTQTYDHWFEACTTGARCIILLQGSAISKIKMI